MTGAEFKNKSQEVIETCKKYGFMDRLITPYGFNITVRDFSRSWIDYDKCTRCSQDIMRCELEGFIPILNAWIKYEEEPLVSVRILEGPEKNKVIQYHRSTAELLINARMAKAI